MTVKRTVLDYLGASRGDSVRIQAQPDGEIWLSGRLPEGDDALTVTRGGVVVPEWVVCRLGLGNGDLVACLERDGAVALKRVATEERRGSFPGLQDVETATHLRRVLTGNLPVEEACAGVSTAPADAVPEHNVAHAVAGRTTLAAWQSRRILGCPDSGDDELAMRLIQRRCELQGSDGSWSGDVLQTARALRELAALRPEKPRW